MRLRVATPPPSILVLLEGGPDPSLFVSSCLFVLLSCARNTTTPADEEIKQTTTRTAPTESGFGRGLGEENDGENKGEDGKSHNANAGLNVVGVVDVVDRKCARYPSETPPKEDP